MWSMAASGGPLPADGGTGRGPETAQMALRHAACPISQPPKVGEPFARGGENDPSSGDVVAHQVAQARRRFLSPSRWISVGLS